MSVASAHKTHIHRLHTALETDLCLENRADTDGLMFDRRGEREQEKLLPVRRQAPVRRCASAGSVSGLPAIKKKKKTPLISTALRRAQQQPTTATTNQKKNVSDTVSEQDCDGDEACVSFSSLIV